MRILSVSAVLGQGADSWRIRNVSAQLRRHGQTVVQVQNAPPSGGPAGTVRELARSELLTLARLRGGGFDLVYGNGQATASCVSSRLARTPLVFDMHGLSEMEYLLRNGSAGDGARRRPRYVGLALLDRVCLRAADTVVCVSRRQMAHLRRAAGVSLDKMVYATNGVDLALFRPLPPAEAATLRRALGMEGKVVFGYVGGMDPWQGVEEFVAAAQASLDPDVGFLVVGGAASYRKGSLVGVRRQPREALPGYYAACDVLVLPRPRSVATDVASPTKFAEYAAMGKPILATKVGDAGDMVEARGCGLTIRDNGASAILDGVAAFKGMTGATLSRMGDSSRALAEEAFDWEKIGAGLTKALLKYER